MKLKGKEEVKKRVDKAVDNFIIKSKKMLTEVGVAVREKGTRLTPVGDTGNLINSWYGPILQQKKDKIFAEIGLTANYAPYVHEMVEANFRKPGAQAKFLETPLKEAASILGGEFQKKVKI